MRLTPLEPYFFGNDKTFKYPGSKSTESGRYFIKGEPTPAPTTLIGVLRYNLLPIKKNFGEYTETDKIKNAEMVGDSGFEYGGTNDFKRIKEISGLFLTSDDGVLIPTPFDHKAGNSSYTPLSDYRRTLDGTVYAYDYDAKAGRQVSYMRLCDGKIYTMKDIFDKESRIGINRGADQDGFFKKQMCRMRQGFSFAAYVLLDGVKPTDTLCYLGQGKSLFSLTFTETSDEEYEDFLHSIEKRLKKGMVYLLSDSFVT
jgi:hypothetical protein